MVPNPSELAGATFSHTPIWVCLKIGWYTDEMAMENMHQPLALGYIYIYTLFLGKNANKFTNLFMRGIHCVKQSMFGRRIILTHTT